MDLFSKPKFLVLSSTAVLIIPFYTWRSFFNLWRDLRKKHNKSILFKQRHNCVVTYQNGKGFAGWPPNFKRYLPDKSNIYSDLYEPILYFIRTAEKSLDIAIMFINVKVVFRELADARRRGINVTIICNFHHCESSRRDIIELIKQGVQFQFFVVPNPNLDSIMHHKFIVKDYSENGGFIVTGSLNISGSSVISNYENMVFSSNHYLVEQFKEEFDKCCEDISIDNQGLINRTILMDAGFF